MGALGLLMILHPHDATGSFARGGLVAAAYTLAMGFSNPALARLVDRTGQTLVLRVGALISGGALAAFAMLPTRALRRVHRCASVAGGAQPPIGACMRALWPVLAPGPEPRHAACRWRAWRSRSSTSPGRS